MIPTDAELSRLELDTYSITPAGEVIAIGCDRVVITRLPTCTVVSIMGTNDASGWISDFKCAGVRAKDHPELGVCESGFLDGAMALWPLLAPTLGMLPIVLQGHSRGASMVPIIAGLMLLSSVKPIRCVMWEAPWCVGAVCRAMILEAGIDGVQYWHGDDPVPMVPAVPWLVSHVWPIRHFGHWKLNAVECHMMAGIVAEMTAAPVLLAA